MTKRGKWWGMKRHISHVLRCAIMHMEGMGGDETAASRRTLINLHEDLKYLKIDEHGFEPGEEGFGIPENKDRLKDKMRDGIKLLKGLHAESQKQLDEMSTQIKRLSGELEVA